MVPPRPVGRVFLISEVPFSECCYALRKFGGVSHKVNHLYSILSKWPILSTDREQIIEGFEFTAEMQLNILAGYRYLNIVTGQGEIARKSSWSGQTSFLDNPLTLPLMEP